MSDIRLKCYFVRNWQHSVLVQNSYTLFNWALLMREIKRKSPKRLRKYVNFLYVWSFPLTLIISCFARKREIQIIYCFPAIDNTSNFVATIIHTCRMIKVSRLFFKPKFFSFELILTAQCTNIRSKRHALDVNRKVRNVFGIKLIYLNSKR